jgi:hypothetical protein
MRILLLLNQTRGHRFDAYHDGDKMEAGWVGRLDDLDAPGTEAFDRSTETRILHGLFERFNIDHPVGYDNRSMSAGDVITLEDEGGRRSYVCERTGWRKLPEPLGGDNLGTGDNTPTTSPKADAQLLEQMDNICAVHSLPEILRALAMLCDRDAEGYVRELDESGIIQSCRRDAEVLRDLASEMEVNHGG